MVLLQVFLYEMYIDEINTMVDCQKLSIEVYYLIKVYYFIITLSTGQLKMTIYQNNLQ